MKDYIVLGSLLALIGCNSAEPQRAAKTAFKGMELYSWKPAGEDWHFSLLVGTNRQKPVEMISSPETAIVGVASLKSKLAQLARGEQVFWRNMGKELVPGEIKRDLTSFCDTLGIELKTL